MATSTYRSQLATQIPRPVEPAGPQAAPSAGREGAPARERTNAKGIRATARWGLYLYALALPLEMPERGISVEIPTLFGILFLALTLLHPRICYRRPPQAFWFFAAYLFVSGVIALGVGGEYLRPAIRVLVLYGLLLLILWPASNLMASRKVADRVVLALICGCVVVSFMQITGIATSRVEVMSGMARVTVLGQNPNSLARNLAVGALALAGVAFSVRKRSLLVRMVAFALFGILAYTVVQTGSRMGLLALGVGIIAFALTAGPVTIRLRTILVVVGAVLFCGWQVMQSSSVTARFEKTFEEHSLAKREMIFPKAWQMFTERPLTGWGPVTNMWVLGGRVGEEDHRYRDTHNLFLEIATSTGALGMVPYCLGLLLCLRAAWVARQGSQGILPLSLLLAVLAANLSANLIAQRLHWFVLAYALGAARQVISVEPAWRLRHQHQRAPE